MSQSTKWLHFGLGRESALENVLVHWAGGASEEFTGLAPGQRWHLVQGSGTARRHPRKTRSMPDAMRGGV
jgi:hypothetical protein